MYEMFSWRNSRPFLMGTIVFWFLIFAANVGRVVIEYRRHDNINTAIAVCFVVMGPIWMWDAARKLRGVR